MKTKEYKLSFFLYNENSIIIEWPKIISENILKDILNFSNKLLKLKTIHSTINGYNSLLIIYKSNIMSFDKEIFKLKSLYENKLRNLILNNKNWKIPVCYEKKHAPDISYVSKKLNLSLKEIVRLHSLKKYRLFFIGFLPGFLYLGKLHNKLKIPRKTSPSTNYQPGSVGIADNQTGIYPNISPGGWNIIGNTPITLFDPSSTQPCFAKSGDTIEFYSINEKEYNLIKQKSKDNLNFINDLND
ncbi:MAG: allophanate hydrolase [Flavobacteriaceae bacterium]|nr:allophanate hydrolase [Flavobacteriaceae bacterium]|tara:strand:+ start:20257 stop:20985 length:729 start_codon:yes stop_codon:yes gene_type:complete